MRELTEAERVQARKISSQMRVGAASMGLVTRGATVVQVETGQAAVVMNFRKRSFDG